MPSTALKKFLALESAAGIILFIAAVAAILMKNSLFAPFYDSLLNVPGLAHGINDGLMSIFFFLVGLEIKREFSAGELSSKENALLPIVAALGGMIFPAIVYLIVNLNHPEVWKGWAIPCATDIAFSLGILSLLGSRVRTSLKVFLTALAIIDDLGAIVIIAFFYTANLDLNYLIFAGCCCAALLAANKSGILNKFIYVLLALTLWYLILKSGVHATIAGVLAALFVPYSKQGRSPLSELEHFLHPYVAYFILPVFAFFNAGINLGGIDSSIFLSPLTLGIGLGLLLGKQLGVMASSWLSIRIGICKMPSGSSWKEFYGIAILTGVGFTMSLFIDHLAFSDPALDVPARLGILSGSLLAGLAGYLVLQRAVK